MIAQAIVAHVVAEYLLQPDLMMDAKRGMRSPFGWVMASVLHGVIWLVLIWLATSWPLHVLVPLGVLHLIVDATRVGSWMNQLQDVATLRELHDACRGAAKQGATLHDTFQISVSATTTVVRIELAIAAQHLALIWLASVAAQALPTWEHVVTLVKSVFG